MGGLVNEAVDFATVGTSSGAMDYESSGESERIGKKVIDDERDGLMVVDGEGEECIYKEMEEVVGINSSVISGICGYISSCMLGDLSLYVWHVS